MKNIMPELQDIRITQKPGRVDAKSLETCDKLLLILPERPSKSVFAKLPQGTKMQAVYRKSASGSAPAFTTRLANKKQTFVACGTLSKAASVFEQLTLGRKLFSAATQQKPGILGICAVGFDDADQQAIVGNMLAAALAGAFRMPTYKAKPGAGKISSIRLLGLNDKLDTGRVEAEAKGNNLARWLTALPPNYLDANAYADLARSLATEHGWQYKRFRTKDLDLSKATNPDLSLVGKGIIFDTGGTNLKPFEFMLDMHGDMQGSAVALGTLLAISELQLPLAVDCWLAITENRTGPTAYKSQDVVTAANGKTIQTIHTDAEGRMALADTLVLASRDEPGILFDYATLTGSVIRALTTRYSGVFTNREHLHAPLTELGEESGERVWPFPIGTEFMEDLASDTADFQQCSVKGVGDHILAASFLAEFIENDVPWVHMDLAAGANKGGLAHVATQFTGFGVRYTIGAILDKDLFKATR